MTIDEFIEVLDRNSDKIYEISVGGYWFQFPLGLFADLLKGARTFVEGEINNESSINA